MEGASSHSLLTGGAQKRAVVGGFTEGDNDMGFTQASRGTMNVIR